MESAEGVSKRLPLHGLHHGLLGRARRRRSANDRKEQGHELLVAIKSGRVQSHWTRQAGFKR
jgi:hypothetical protein